MNKYKNFLLESIYDIDVLKNLDLGQKNNKEIFSESRSQKKNMPGTVYGDTSKGIMFAGKPGSFVGSKGGTPAPAPTPPKGLIKVKSLTTETEITKLIDDSVRISIALTESDDNVLKYIYGRTTLNRKHDENMKFLSNKILCTPGEASTAIRAISHTFIFNYLSSISPSLAIEIEKIISKTKSYKNVFNFIGSYFTLPGLRKDSYDFDLSNLKPVYAGFDKKKITVENIDAFRDKFKAEIEKQYDLK